MLLRCWHRAPLSASKAHVMVCTRRSRAISLGSVLEQRDKPSMGWKYSMQGVKWSLMRLYFEQVIEPRERNCHWNARRRTVIEMSTSGFKCEEIREMLSQRKERKNPPRPSYKKITLHQMGRDWPEITAAPASSCELWAAHRH